MYTPVHLSFSDIKMEFEVGLNYHGDLKIWSTETHVHFTSADDVTFILTQRISVRVCSFRVFLSSICPKYLNILCSTS